MTKDLTGIVLVGGRSTRMQTDKSVLDYHGKPQREYVYRMLEKVCSEVFFSCRPDQVKELEMAGFNSIADLRLDEGPMAALISIFNNNPISAKLVVAVDLPYLDLSTIKFLVDSRHSNKLATAFRNPIDGKPDPLLTMWEPKSFPLAQRAFESGQMSPRKFLIQHDIGLIEPPNPQALVSVDSIDGYQKALGDLSSD